MKRLLLILAAVLLAGCATQNVGPEPPSRGVWTEPETATITGPPGWTPGGGA